MGYRRVAIEPVVKPLRTTRSQRRTEEYKQFEFWPVEDDDGGAWWLVEPDQAVIFDPKFDGWQLVGPRVISHSDDARSTFGDPFMAFPRKLVKGDVELTWDGETWAGVPGGPPDDVLKVMQAASTGSGIGGQPDTKGELLERIRAVVRDSLLKHPDKRPLQQDVATAVEGLDPHAVPGSTFRRVVKKGGSWDAIIEAEREALDQF